VMQGRTSIAITSALEAGASYADARFVTSAAETARARNGALEGLTSANQIGIGVRVIADGAWGFAATSEPDEAAIRAAARRAVELARAAATTRRNPVRLTEVEPVIDDVRASFEIDPADILLQDRIALLMDCDRLMNKSDVAVTEGHVSVLRQSKHFCSSEGADIHQELIETGGRISATAIDGNETQRRSYPGSHGGQVMTRGWEVIEEMRLAEHAEEIAQEAVALLAAPQCPSGEMDIILAGEMLALQVHESCGHPIELDRVLGTEASYAGTSFLTPDKLGTFRYGSDVVNISADATIPGGLGSFAYDDEGVPAQRAEIVKNGIFVGYLTSRETTAQLGLGASNGTMRADGPNRLPIIRMTNINLEPGDIPMSEIIRTTERGLLMDTNQSWSIDDKRLNFQFGCEVARVIEDGEITGIVRNPTYTGITPEFWGACDAVADEETWTVQGVPNCGKGEPGQTAHVGHGVSAARFRNVQVGVLGDE